MFGSQNVILQRPYLPNVYCFPLELRELIISLSFVKIDVVTKTTETLLMYLMGFFIIA